MPQMFPFPVLIFFFLVSIFFLFCFMKFYLNLYVLETNKTIQKKNILNSKNFFKF